MESAVLGASVLLVFENLISLLKREFSSICNIKKEVEKLLRTLSTIQSVLEDAEEKQIQNKPIAQWLRNLKDATYNAEDLLDTLSLEIQNHGVKFSNTGSTNQVCCTLMSCLNLKKIMFRRKIAIKIGEIISTFDEIAKQKSQFLLNTSVVSVCESQLIKERETSSVIIEPHIYGRAVDRKTIIDILVNNVGCEDDVSIFPILGMGGLGKTVLAQSIYNDQRVGSCFEVRIWVCVSETFDVERILKAIIEAFEGKTCGLKFLEPIQKKVAEILKGKRYLIVLDDLWNENQQQWNKLKSLLRSGAKGSSIIITTRLKTVASLTGTLPTYHLGGLSNEDCWSLLKHRAFGDTNVEHPNLVEIGVAIAKKCKGIPLAAKSLGSLLGSNTNEWHWELVRDSDIWNLNEGGENTILPILRLSYNHLPSRSKQCFSYCAIFPKDRVIEKKKLISLWIANGYIQSQGRIELEEIGDDIFNELLRWSFFQETKEDCYGNIETCKMHDLMHDLACSVAVKECLIAKLGETKDVPKFIRHLTVDHGSSQTSTDIDPLFTCQTSLRTVVIFHPINFHRFEFSSTLRVLDLNGNSVETLPPSVCNLQHLRYLDLSHNRLTSLPKSIHKLRNLQMLDLRNNEGIRTMPLSVINLENLRYLNLSGCKGIKSLPEFFNGMKNLRSLNLSNNEQIAALPLSVGTLESLRYLDLKWCKGVTLLPESISGLRNLQLLILRGCERLEVLPESTRNLTSLRHLDIRQCKRLNKMPVGIGQLSCLQTLDHFTVGRPSDGDDGVGGGISELQGLNQLRGKLKIIGLENVRNSVDAKKANLGNKQCLTNLTLMYDDSVQQSNNKDMLKELQLPPNIQKLKIYGWETYFGQGFLQNLNALRFLRICYCENLVSLPDGLQKLTSLESLEIRDCTNIKCLPMMGIQGLNSSSLVQLEIFSCDNLTSLSDGLQYLTSLKHLLIRECPELAFSEDDFQHLISLRDLSLKDLPKMRALPESIQHLTMLQELDIEKCSNLRKMPDGLQKLLSLETLRIKECRSLKRFPVMGIQASHNFSLVKLVIDRCANLTSLCEGLQHLTSLNELTISKCPELVLSDEDFQHLISLRDLQLDEFPKLTALPESIQHLRLLQSLKIEKCSNLRMLPEWLKHLTSLENLDIRNCEVIKCLPVMGSPWSKTSLIKLSIISCPNLTSLSEGLLYLTSLEFLHINSCPELELETCDFQNYTSLQRLELWDLPQLTYLPEGIQHLPVLEYLVIGNCENMQKFPEWMKHVRTLEFLTIRDCHPDLYSRCERENGVDWPKISHIPRLDIR